MDIKLYFRQNRTKLFIILVMAVINAALVILLVPKTSETPRPAAKEPAICSIQQADTVLKAVLASFGVKDSMIKAQPQKKNKKKTVSIQYLIKIPSDIPIPFVIYDLQNRYAGKGIDLVNREVKINSMSVTEIILSQDEKIVCEFQVQKNIVRNSGSIMLIISDPLEIQPDEFSNMLKHDHYISFMVPASTEGRRIADILEKNSRQYAVLLSDDISDMDYQLKEKFSLTRLKNTVKTIASGFQKASFYFTQSSSHIYSSYIRKLIEPALKDNGKKLLTEKEVKFFPSIDNDAAAEGWLASVVKPDETATKIIISSALYNSCQQVFSAFRKRGGKVITL